jgi:hypothetical protein
MKLVPEKLNEVDFERGKDPKESLGLGIRLQIKKDLEEARIDPKDVNILDDLVILNKRGFRTEELFPIQMKYMPKKKANFVKDLRNENIKPELAVEDALASGIPPEEIKVLIEEFGKFKEKYREINHKAPAVIHLTKLTRTPEKEKEDEENNIYAFIGWQGKIPVEINGKKYYEDGLETEAIIKIDKFDIGSLHNITGMQLRARYSGHNANVYTIHIPSELMDEERYEEIPEHLREIFDKYKQKI